VGGRWGGPDVTEGEFEEAGGEGVGDFEDGGEDAVGERVAVSGGVLVVAGGHRRYRWWALGAGFSQKQLGHRLTPSHCFAFIGVHQRPKMFFLGFSIAGVRARFYARAQNRAAGGGAPVARRASRRRIFPAEYGGLEARPNCLRVLDFQTGVAPGEFPACTHLLVGLEITPL